jgi:hypothetical protein
MKVWPKNADVRRLIKHPTARGFRATGYAEWPADVFTFRLLQDGDITSSEPAPDPSKPTPPVAPKPPPSGSGSSSTS